MMNVKTLASMLNPRCKRYDELDAVGFLEDPSISKFKKLEALFGKRWVHVKQNECERLLADPKAFIKQWLEVEAWPCRSRL